MVGCAIALVTNMRSFIKIALKAVEKNSLYCSMGKTQIPQIRCPSDWLVMYWSFGALVL